jgi:hypothetical protein
MTVLQTLEVDGITEAHDVHAHIARERHSSRMPQQRDLSRATHVSWHGFSCGYLIHSAVLTGKTPTVNDKYVGIQTLIFGLQAVIFLLQLFVFAYQAWKLRKP